MSKEEDEIIRAAMNKDLAKFPQTVNEKKVPNSPAMSVVYNEPLTKIPNVKDIGDRNYSSQTGVPLVHPLQLMTLIMQECPHADLAVKTISSACAGTDPLFQLTSKANGRNKSVASSKKMDTLYKKLMNPNPLQTGSELFITTYENLAVYGNAYWQVIRNRKGEIHSIYTLPPESIRVVPYFDKDKALHCAYYQYDLVNASDGDIYLEHEIIHFKETNEKSFLYGKPRLYSLFGYITANAQALNAINSWFEKGWAGGAIFQQDADEIVAARNREFLKQNYVGAGNYGKILLMEGGIKLVSDGQKYIGNVKFEEMSAVGRDTVLNCMGVPVSIAGVRSDAGQGNAEVIASEEKAFKRNTVDRLHNIVFPKIQQKLIGEFLQDDDIQIQPGALSKFSLKEEAEAVRVLSTIGITIGEARAILGMRTLESEALNNQMLILTNNGGAKFEDVVGIDYDGNKVETLFDKQFSLQKMTAEANVANAKLKQEGKTAPTTMNKNGLGGQLKEAADGK